MVLILNIPTIRYHIEKQQLKFIRKLVSNSEDQIPTQLLTAWCDKKRKLGAPLQNNRKNLAQNIRLIVPGAEKYGLLTTCVYLVILLDVPNSHCPVLVIRRW